jgi:hypothetical protein
MLKMIYLTLFKDMHLKNQAKAKMHDVSHNESRTFYHSLLAIQYYMENVPIQAFESNHSARLFL